MMRFFQRFLLPGFVFQGIVVGGGYATGRELIEFFLPSGPLGGLFGMAMVAVVWSVVMAISFELCRMAGRYDYKSFFQRLLGRYWVAYEVCFLATMTLALAVIGAATGEIVRDRFGLPEVFGSVLLLAAIGGLAFRGTAAIERFMGVWSLLLYGAYIFIVARTVSLFGDGLWQTMAAADAGGPWLVDGLRYAGYNVAAVPAVFFCLRHITRRREALVAGSLGGLIAIVPGILFYIALMALYPDIGQATIPSVVLLDRLAVPAFAAVFQIILLGTFVQTGVGLVHTFNERIAATLSDRGRPLTRMHRPMIAAALLFIALVLATNVGLVGLIAHGYGVITWGFIALFVLPTVTVGLYRVVRRVEQAA